VARTVAERSDALSALAECFREHGYEGASLALIGKATGLGKGSLYHFFPGGKAEMAAAVLAEIDDWFEREIFAPLREADPPRPGIAHMFEATEEYLRSGRRVCLVGAFALGDARDRFGAAVKDYFVRWIDALSAALLRAGWEQEAARAAAEDVVGGIQGAIVLARSLDDPRAFTGMLARMRKRLMG
jgi:AcrR family transcriptional regulator